MFLVSSKAFRFRTLTLLCQKLFSTSGSGGFCISNSVISLSTSNFLRGMHRSDYASKYRGLKRPDLENYAPASNLALNEQIRAKRLAGEDVFHLAFGQSPFPVLPALEEGLRHHSNVNDYLPVSGIKELREALNAFHRRFDGVEHFDADSVVVGPGSKELTFLLLQVFYGDVFLLAPSWTTYHPQCLLSRHEPIKIPTSFENMWKLTPNALQEALRKSTKANKMLIFNNPCNPSGTSYSEDELKALADILREGNVVVLSDEIYSRLHFGTFVPLAKFYPEGTIVATGFSKWASAGGYRLGYHMYPKELTELRMAVRSAGSHTYSCAQAPGQYAALDALTEKMADCELYIKHTARILAALGQFCARELSACGVRVHVPTAGYYIFPDFECVKTKLREHHGITTVDGFVQKLFQDSRVALMSGSSFLRPDDEYTTRLCYVDFDGADGLNASMKLGLDHNIDDAFVEKYCNRTFKGIKVLCEWVRSNSST